jgi:hypothetical protein
VKLPVIGVGDISRGDDALEWMMAGTSAVGVCTAAIMRGHQVYGEIAGQMRLARRSWLCQCPGCAWAGPQKIVVLHLGGCSSGACP